MLAKALPEGEYPSLAFVTGDKRKGKKYIQALEDIFILRRCKVREEGVGNDHWISGDSGLAFHLSSQKNGHGTRLRVPRTGTGRRDEGVEDTTGCPGRAYEQHSYTQKRYCHRTVELLVVKINLQSKPRLKAPHYALRASIFLGRTAVPEQR